jgi:hypothetical protein
MNSQVWWFVARSSGIVAWALLTLSVCWGLLLSTRLLSRRVGPSWLLDLHRHLGGLAVVFTGVHLVGLVADSYVTFGWAELFIPMASSWKPGAVAFGIVAFYLLLAIEITSLAMRRLPRSVWRWVHRSSFVLFGFATYHGIVAGTDAGNDLYRFATWMSIAVVVTLTLVLMTVARRTRTRLGSFPPVVVRVDSEDVAVAESNWPAPSLAPPTVSPHTKPKVVPERVASSPMPATRFGVIAPLGSIEPFVPDVPAGPPSPVVPNRRIAPTPGAFPAPVDDSPPLVAPASWSAPTGVPVIAVEARERVRAGRAGADAGEPPTAAT